jgi:hypothetical protein
MGIFAKGQGRLPREAIAALGIPSGEKVVAWGSSKGGASGEIAVSAATDRALYLQSRGERLPWDRISKASWDEPILELVVAEAGVSRIVRERIDQSADLPAAVHDRVTASVVVSERVDLGGGAGALMVARRASDVDDIRWTVVFDPGLDPNDPALRAAADEALSRLRSALGI